MKQRKALAFLVVLTVALVAALAHARMFRWPSAKGIQISYELSDEPFGGMYNGNWHVSNDNDDDVEITFQAVYDLSDGDRKTKSVGPLRVRAHGKLRTGWTGDGDVWDGRKPVDIRIESLRVLREE